jgi:hypothetical protein
VKINVIIIAEKLLCCKKEEVQRVLRARLVTWYPGESACFLGPKKPHAKLVPRPSSPFGSRLGDESWHFPRCYQGETSTSRKVWENFLGLLALSRDRGSNAGLMLPISLIRESTSPQTWVPCLFSFMWTLSRLHHLYSELYSASLLSLASKQPEKSPLQRKGSPMLPKLRTPTPLAALVPWISYLSTKQALKQVFVRDMVFRTTSYRTTLFSPKL